MERQIQDLMREEGRTRSELFREVLRRYIDDRCLRAAGREIGERKLAARVILSGCRMVRSRSTRRGRPA